MTLHEPYKRLASVLAVVAAINLALVFTGSPLVAPVSFVSAFIDGFLVAAYLVLRREFWVEAIDQEGDRWELRWVKR